MRVTGSELVGLVPKKVLIDAGIHFLKKQKRSIGIHESEIIKIAIKTLGLDELAPFEPKKRIIEYMIDVDENKPLVNMSITDFADETYLKVLLLEEVQYLHIVEPMGVSLGTMVANLSHTKEDGMIDGKNFQNGQKKEWRTKELY